MNIRRRRPMGSLFVVLGLLLVSCKGREPIGPGPTILEPPVPKSTGPIAFVSDRDGTEQIYLANEDGSLVTRLTAGSYPAWSRDGQRLAFSRAREIYVINVDGSGLRRVVAGFEPAWSPDGQMLVFRGATRWGIDVVDVSGSNHRALYDNEFGADAPAWSPDGRRIALCVGSFVGDSIVGLWVMNADGSDPHWIGQGDGGFPAWSPDGSEIAFVAWGPTANLEVVKPDGSGRRFVTGQATEVDWTRDGRLIFTRSPRGRFAPGERVFIRDGGVDRQLIPDVAAPMHPGYSDRQAVWRR